MDLLRDAEWRAGFELVGRLIDAAASADALARAAVAGLPRLVASELTTLWACGLASGRRHVIGSPAAAIGADERAAFERHFGAHPLVRYHAMQRGPGAHRIGESVPFGRFRATALAADTCRRIGIDHAVSVPPLVDDARPASFAAMRKGRDFGDRERLLPDAVDEPIVRL
jgi:hypothetical protein